MTTTKNKVDVYQIVTDKIIQKLEQGVIPWKKPWKPGDIAYNRVTKKTYSFLNQMMLGQGGEWATYKQWTEAGGKVIKGSKSERVVFWKMLVKKEKDEVTGEDVVKQIPVLKYSNVFHISQVEGVEPVKDQNDILVNTGERILNGEDIINGYMNREGIMFVEAKNGSRAYYSPSDDAIKVPCFEQFFDSPEYYSTVFHEIIHSTGIEKRLKRDMGGKFGSKKYSKEELIAEIGAAYLMCLAGIENENTFDNSAAYIKSWIRALKNDNRLIVSASSKAEKAAKFVVCGTAFEEAYAIENQGQTQRAATNRRTRTKRIGSNGQTSEGQVISTQYPVPVAPRTIVVSA